MEKPKKTLKLKAILVSEDGVNWRMYRQFYITEFPNGPFTDLVLVGKTFKLVDQEGGDQCQK